MGLTMENRRVRTADLDDREWERVWAFASRYLDSDRSAFEKSVRSKRHLCQALEGGQVVGIAAIDAAPVAHRGRTLVRIFTANTLIAESHRGRNLIQRWALGEWIRVRLRHPRAPIYWMFDTFSYRSYLLLCRNFATYWPRRDEPTPPAVLEVMDQLARPLYGPDWDAASGVVRARGKRLKAFVSPIDDRARGNPDVRYFEERNPRHAEGEMLLCLAPLDARNCARIAVRTLRRLLTPRAR